jgi:plasmid stabilization system protein ParE
MKYKCRFNPIAANEYEGAYSWYFERSVKAAENFVIAIDEAIHAICANPHRYRNSYKELREILVKKYPFYLIYLIDERKKTILITSVYHNKRDPDKKYAKSP